MDYLKPAGRLNYKGIIYKVYWDSSNGEVWYSDGGKEKVQIGKLSSKTKKDAKNKLLDFFISQDEE